MTDWININKQKPEQMRAVFVKGVPFDNHDELRTIGIMDEHGDFYTVESDWFGWVESYNDISPDITSDKLDGVADWAPLPDFMYD